MLLDDGPRVRVLCEDRRAQVGDRPALAQERRPERPAACDQQQTVILMTTPVLSLLKHVMKVQGGAIK